MKRVMVACIAFCAITDIVVGNYGASLGWIVALSYAIPEAIKK